MFSLSNILTGANLLSGCVAILFAFGGRLEWAVLAIFIGALFDFFDGFAARMLKQTGELGKQLDSLADMVTFGVAPSVIVFILLILSGAWNEIQAAGGGIENLWLEGTMGYSVQFWIGVYLNDLVNNNNPAYPTVFQGWSLIAPFFAFFIAFMSLFRLAKFNIDPRQSEGFIGLPTPANTIFFASFALLLWDGFDSNDWRQVLSMTLIQDSVLLSLVVIFSFLLVAEIPLFSLKLKSFGWTENKVRYIFISISIVMLIFLHVWAFPLIILTYLLISFVQRMLPR
jgi:CDP-diacylglycerol--serine O-phosphatidyltransferase